jgi:hypothetical protein
VKRFFARLRRAWRDMAIVEESIADEGASRWRRAGAFLLRVATFVVMLALLPFRAAIVRWWQGRASERLRRHAAALWRRSPLEALAVLRRVHATLERARRAGTLDIIRGEVEIGPFGRFDGTEALVVELQLYDYELALGHFEEALALVGPLTSAFAVRRKVDCLLGMRRRDEAIACLRANLHLDGRRGTLRARLVELEGSARGGLN